jgi:hypothetical protein
VAKQAENATSETATARNGTPNNKEQMPTTSTKYNRTFPSKSQHTGYQKKKNANSNTLSDERLLAYGINPKVHRRKEKFIGIKRKK